jgi:hypothetical protein
VLAAILLLAKSEKTADHQFRKLQRRPFDGNFLWVYRKSRGRSQINSFFATG